ncbi:MULTISPECIES: malonyl-ACP O-methyltransferase BioC [unclassified Rhodanobacter]|uniref:malonyl-ACP O-methyltransferase BioC n=1 Tax=unclassified Rhodanobacter TaxID=2621553 RepID=UPI001BDEB77A|nr:MULTISPECIES: malonyl-ACP O-methyltransferase BioC [unclassified Rhodanobacter]MBT2143900.1 malonyl-ACP O-methyltransferase BioC [Rhodanobacter sp. LX-99]MBT2147026.1 malonyl-ACP O-methyltransferase BioC [Rhodanobacter sp. LX-100]
MSDFQLDPKQVRRHFGRAATSYEKHDALQREVGDALLERLGFYLETPQRVVDVGAGTGRGTALLKQRYPKAEVIALDLALPMLRAAKQHNSWLKPFMRVCAEATHLPLADHSVDVLYSNLCFQWVDDLPALFGECMRVLKPGGFMAFSSFGPDTLKELRAAWAEADQQPHVGRFLDMHDVGDAMLNAGLRDPVLDVFRYTLTYSEPRKLLEELQGLGATNADRARARGLTGKGRYRRMLAAYEAMRMDGRIPASWEVVSAHAWGPPVGQPRRVPGGEIASFSIDSLRGSRRR